MPSLGSLIRTAGGILRVLRVLLVRYSPDCGQVAEGDEGTTREDSDSKLRFASRLFQQ